MTCKLKNKLTQNRKGLRERPDQNIDPREGIRETHVVAMRANRL